VIGLGIGLGLRSVVKVVRVGDLAGYGVAIATPERGLTTKRGKDLTLIRKAFKV